MVPHSVVLTDQPNHCGLLVRLGWAWARAWVLPAASQPPAAPRLTPLSWRFPPHSGPLRRRWTRKLAPTPHRRGCHPVGVFSVAIRRTTRTRACPQLPGFSCHIERLRCALFCEDTSHLRKDPRAGTPQTRPVRFLTNSRELLKDMCSHTQKQT